MEIRTFFYGFNLKGANGYGSYGLRVKVRRKKNFLESRAKL